MFLKNFQNSLSQHTYYVPGSLLVFPLLDALHFRHPPTTHNPAPLNTLFPQKYYTRRTKEKTFTVHLSFAVVDKFSTTHSIVPFHRCIVSLGFSTEGATAPRLCFLVWNAAAGCCVLVWLRCVLFSTTAFYVWFVLISYRRTNRIWQFWIWRRPIHFLIWSIPQSILPLFLSWGRNCWLWRRSLGCPWFPVRGEGGVRQCMIIVLEIQLNVILCFEQSEQTKRSGEVFDVRLL